MKSETLTGGSGEWLDALEYFAIDMIERGASKTSVILDKFNNTVNRFLCPNGWLRVGKSCYTLVSVFSKQDSLADQISARCQREAVLCGKMESDAIARVSVAQIGDFEDVEKIAKFLTKKNVSSCMPVVLHVPDDLLIGRIIEIEC
ncbi:hypothetical protein ACOME3_008843 [Neoechinorhynchus agilis]